MILKSYIVEQNIEILKNYTASLIYGENEGIKDDVKEKIKELNKDCEIITFFENDILKNKVLFENISNQSLFFDKKIIFLQECSDKIFDQIEECLEKINIDIQIYVFSGILEKRSKLRSLFEKSKLLAVLPCYEDNERTLVSYISRELKDLKGLTGEIINIIINNSNKNRKIIKDEIQKIKVFFLHNKINKKEIFEILNIKNSNNFDEIRDNALNCEKKKINELLSGVELQKENTFFYLNNLNSRIVKLQEIIQTSDGDENKYETIIGNLKPPIFWKDRPMIIQQLKKYNLKTLGQLAYTITKTEILLKKNSHIRDDIVIKDLVINITSRARSIFS